MIPFFALVPTPPVPPRCSKSCCEAERSSAGGLKVQYSCLTRTRLAPGEGLLDYSDTLEETGDKAVVPHATYAFHTRGSTLKWVLPFSNTLNPPLLFHHSRQIELNLDLPSPVSGFAAIGLGNGKFMITTRSLNLTINDPKLDQKNATWAPKSVQVTAFAQLDAFCIHYWVGIIQFKREAVKKWYF